MKSTGPPTRRPDRLLQPRYQQLFNVHPERITLAKAQRSQSYNPLSQKQILFCSRRLCAFARELLMFMDGHQLGACSKTISPIFRLRQVRYAGWRRCPNPLPAVRLTGGRLARIFHRRGRRGSQSFLTFLGFVFPQ